MRRLLFCLLAVTLIGAGPANVGSGYFTNLQYRMIGPFRGGRALAVTGVPGQPEHFYFGAVDGGVWESFNAGRTWNPIFDGVNVGSIGAIAVAPSNANVIYVGSGEADMRSDIAYGNGMYVSTDAGKTWKHSGLEDSRQIGAVVVDPRDPRVAFAAALGHQYGPSAERGVFKTVDGGATWNKVLFKDENTGAVSLAMDPANPQIVYATLWQTRRPPWNVYPPSNGPGSGLYKTSDGGKTWTQLHGGLPDNVGRIGISVAPSHPQTVYANVDSDVKHGGVYRSDDGGTTWNHTDGDPRIWQRGWYFSGITVDPKNAEISYVMDTSTYRSTDGGKSYTPILGDPTGDDYHTLWIDPSDAGRMILGSDQGVGVSVDGAKTWSSWYNQPTAQFYHVTVDDAFPFWVYGAQQDSGAATAPSNSRYGSISQQDFRPLDVGGESGELSPDPKHPGYVYGGTVTREQIFTGWEQNIDPTLKYPDRVWRNTWTLPLTISPLDKTTIYFGRQNVFRSRDGGQSWTIVSPDLSRADEGTPANLDPPTLADNNGLQRHGVVYTIAPSPRVAGLIWAGTDDGNIWVTRDDGRHWNDVTPPRLTSWSKVGTIEASHFDSLTAYAAIDRHRLDDYAPYIYRTRDGGTTWTTIANGIPNGAFVNAVREDPRRPGLLFAGTEWGMYVSFDDGDHWQSLQLNLPISSIRDMAIHRDDLVVATHGRSFWMLDDMSSLRAMGDAVAKNGNYLFPTADAYRLRDENEEGTPLPLDEPQALNAAAGAYFDYYLADAAHTPVVLAVLDKEGTVERTWSSADKPHVVDPTSVDFTTHWIPVQALPATNAGAHRFVWDFREGGRGPLVPPGTYTVRLTVDGASQQRTFTVMRDPRIPASNADLRAQYELAKQIQSTQKAVIAARKAATAAAQHIAPSQAHAWVTEIIGEPPTDMPDDSVGSPSHDFTSYTFLDNSLSYLFSAVESADASPTPDMRASYEKLKAIFAATQQRASAIERMR